MKIIIAILIFSAIILFHELGHFLFAKLNKIVVTEFSLGMGPRLLSTEKNGTRYSLKLLPIGGSCAMLGEDTDIENEPGTFNGASVWGRISVVAAGPVFNFIMAFVLSVIIVGAVGYEPSRVLSVTEGSAAEKAGLKEGDIITSYQGYHIDLGKDLYVYSYLNELKEGDTINLTVKRDGKKMDISYKSDTNVRYLLGCNFNGDDASVMTVESVMDGMPLQAAGVQAGDVITSINGTEISNSEDYQKYIQENPLTGAPVELTYKRDGKTYDITVTPKEYRTAESGFTYNVYCAKGLDVIRYGAVEVKYMVRTTILSLKELVTGKLGMKDLSGPVGVVDAIGTTYEESKSEGTMILWMNMLNMAVLLSANLGVMNLLPLPALDGGRLVFLIIEAIRRKPINRKVEGSIHFAGLMLLMALMVFVMYNDIVKLI